MAMNDNPHALRLIQALDRIAGGEAAQSLSAQHPLSKGADAARKFCWALDICASLSDSFDPQTVRSIRRECRCGDGRTMAREIHDCVVKAGNLRDGCDLFTQKNRYAFLEYVSESELIFGYHACVCSCVKRIDAPLPLAWCECSAGYAQAMLQQAFGEHVQVELLTSVKSGSRRCEMRATIS